MGWGRYLLLGNLGQQLDLSDQEEEIENLKNELRRSRGSGAEVSEGIARLQGEVDEMRLYLAALVRLLVSKGLVTQEEIKRFVDVIDAEDGASDGRYGGPMG